MQWEMVYRGIVLLQQGDVFTSSQYFDYISLIILKHSLSFLSIQKYFDDNSLTGKQEGHRYTIRSHRIIPDTYSYNAVRMQKSYSDIAKFSKIGLFLISLLRVHKLTVGEKHL